MYKWQTTTGGAVAGATMLEYDGVPQDPFLRCCLLARSSHTLLEVWHCMNGRIRLSSLDKTT